MIENFENKKYEIQRKMLTVKINLCLMLYEL